MKNNFSQIKDFKEGSLIKGFYLCKSINLKLTRLGDQYIDLFLEDSSGLIRSKIWSNVNYYKHIIAKTYPVAVKGKVVSYNNNLELDIFFIKSIENNMYNKYGYNEKLLFEYSSKKMKEKFNSLSKYVSLLSPRYKAICKNYISKYQEQILTIPSINKKYSHRGGFLIQLVNLLEINSKIHNKYSLEFDKTCMGIIFKNIGLIKYYDDNLLFTVSKANFDRGYKIIGLDIIEKHISKNNIDIVDFLKNNIINDSLNSDDTFIRYINNIYQFDSKMYK